MSDAPNIQHLSADGRCVRLFRGGAMQQLMWWGPPSAWAVSGVAKAFQPMPALGFVADVLHSGKNLAWLLLYGAVLLQMAPLIALRQAGRSLKVLVLQVFLCFIFGGLIAWRTEQHCGCWGAFDAGFLTWLNVILIAVTLVVSAALALGLRGRQE